MATLSQATEPSALADWLKRKPLPYPEQGEWGFKSRRCRYAGVRPTSAEQEAKKKNEKKKCWP